MDVVNSSKIIYLVVGASRHTYIAICGGKSKHGEIFCLLNHEQNTHTHTHREDKFPSPQSYNT